MGLPSAPSGSREWDIVGIGDIDVDMFLGVDRLAGRDEKVRGALLGEYPGGMIANVCCASARLGASSAMIGRVGDDPYGPVAVRDLQDHGVDTSLVRVIPGGRTFYCVIMLDDSGEKALTAVDTDCHLPRREDIDPDSFARTRLVHLTGDDLETSVWAAQQARARQTLVSLDLEPSTAAHGLQALGPLLACTDVLFMNETGCRSAFGDEPAVAASRALQLGPRVAVVTMGARGALAVDDSAAIRVAALSVPVVDTTGAGDCFIAGFLTRLLDGWDIDPATRYAVAAASVSISAVGSRNALPTHREALERMDRTVLSADQPGEA